MYLLDTNVVSEMRKARSGKADPRVVAWTATIDVQVFYLSVVTILELEQGTLSLERSDSAQAAILRRWLDGSVIPAFEGRILPIDIAVARRCARLHVPDRRGERDALIAATALAHGMTVVTRNVADFTPTGVPTLDPWSQ